MLLTTATAWADTGNEADGVYYIGADGKLKNTATDGIYGNDTPTALDANYPNTSESFPAGWYVVTEDFEFTAHIETTGEIHLILADGKTMTVTVDGTAIHLGGSLNIYGQSLGTGKLTATGSQSGISANNDQNLTINGGNVTATGNGDAGISADNVTINGGIVTATGGNYGINAQNNVTISGGIVTASSYSGTVNLTCGYRNADGSKIIVSGEGISLSTYGGVTIYPAVAVSYLDEHGVERTVPSKDYTILEGNPVGGADLDGGTYVVCSNITYTGTVTLDDDVTLILTDGCTMNIGTSESRISGKGINGGNDATLTIYGQAAGTGALSVYTTRGMNDAIIANALTINGGNIKANTDGNEAYALYAFTDVTINGGTVTATSDNGTGIAAGMGITLGWNKPTDRIYASSYDGTVTFSKAFTDGSTTYYGDYNVSYINNALKDKTLSPLLNLTLTANGVEDGGVTNYWTTFYCGHTGYKIDDGENAWAYTAEYNGMNSQLTLHKLGKVIPKGNAVIIVGEDNEISMTASTEPAENTVSNNLHGVDVSTSVTDIKDYDDDILYVMGKQNGQFGFFEYTGANMPASKAYLLVSGGAAQVKGLTMVFDGSEDATSIQNSKLKIQNEEAGWYSLDGRRLDGKPTAKGIVIHNGKKVVVK